MVALFAFGVISTAAYGAGLVGYWSFDDGTAKDQSGMGNHGEIIGDPQRVAGKIGDCLDFDGDGDGITVPDDPSLQLEDALTVVCWIKARTGVDHGGICWKGEMIGWGANFNYRMATTGGGLTWGTTSGGSENYFATDGVLQLDKWMFLAMTADGAQEIGYISVDGGAFEIPTSGQGNPKAGGAPYNIWEGQPVRIGWAQGMSGTLDNLTFFDGLIDEVAIYNAALTEEELGRVMNDVLAAVEPDSKLVTTWAGIKAK
jgi:hypothetical protein